MPTPVPDKPPAKRVSAKAPPVEPKPWWDRIVRYRWGLCIAFVVFYYTARYETGLLPIPKLLEQIIRSKPGSPGTWAAPSQVQVLSESFLNLFDAFL